ncbi:hypothetical protein CP8484711_1902B, partial [Chlamydia psittaci 84-8471/1]
NHDPAKIPKYPEPK